MHGGIYPMNFLHGMMYGDISVAGVTMASIQANSLSG